VKGLLFVKENGLGRKPKKNLECRKKGTKVEKKCVWGEDIKGGGTCKKKHPSSITGPRGKKRQPKEKKSGDVSLRRVKGVLKGGNV